MLKHHIVAQDPLTRKYRLGSQLAALAHAQMTANDLSTIATPHLQHLRAVSNETATLQALVNTTSVCLAREESTEQLRFTVTVGQSWPLSQLGATSRVMLAFLDELRLRTVLTDVEQQRGDGFAQHLLGDFESIRQRGTTRTRAERIRGSASVAAALFDSHGSVCGAISISGPGERLTDALMDTWEPELRRSAATISRELGFRDTRLACAPGEEQ